VLFIQVVYGKYVSCSQDQQILGALVDYWISPFAVKKDFELPKRKFKGDNGKGKNGNGNIHSNALFKFNRCLHVDYERAFDRVNGRWLLYALRRRIVIINCKPLKCQAAQGTSMDELRCGSES